MSILQSARRHPKLIGIAVLGAAILFVLVWFQPQKLILDSQVSESLPGTTSQPLDNEDQTENRSDEGSAANNSIGSRPKLEVLASGDFRALAHSVSGQAKLLEVESGDTYLRLEDFMVENGPDLRVYLSMAPSGSESAAFGDDFVDLGALKGNVGDQNYRIPPGNDLDSLKSAVIWCRRFSVGFAVAPIGG